MSVKRKKLKHKKYNSLPGTAKTRLVLPSGPKPFDKFELIDFYRLNQNPNKERVPYKVLLRNNVDVFSEIALNPNISDDEIARLFGLYWNRGKGGYTMNKYKRAASKLLSEPEINYVYDPDRDFHRFSKKFLKKREQKKKELEAKGAWKCRIIL